MIVNQSTAHAVVSKRQPKIAWSRACGTGNRGPSCLTPRLPGHKLMQVKAAYCSLMQAIFRNYFFPAEAAYPHGGPPQGAQSLKITNPYLPHFFRSSPVKASQTLLRIFFVMRHLQKLPPIAHGVGPICWPSARTVNPKWLALRPKAAIKMLKTYSKNEQLLHVFTAKIRAHSHQSMIMFHRLI
jgi:hypothetical protein